MLLSEVLYENYQEVEDLTDRWEAAEEVFDDSMNLLHSEGAISPTEWKDTIADFDQLSEMVNRALGAYEKKQALSFVEEMERMAEKAEAKVEKAGITESYCEEIFTDVDGNILTEAAMRQFKRVGTQVKRQFRCTAGPKKGRIVATPRSCATRKDPRKVRHGRKVSRMRMGIRVRKTRISKKKAISKMVRKMNQRLAGTTPKKTTGTK